MLALSTASLDRVTVSASSYFTLDPCDLSSSLVGYYNDWCINTQSDNASTTKTPGDVDEEAIAMKRLSKTSHTASTSPSNADINESFSAATDESMSANVAPATSETISSSTEPVSSNVGSNKKGLKILFLSSDTGGGHRASCESLARQFELLYPNSKYDLLDVVEKDGVPPYNNLVSFYKHLSAHPTQWKMIYGISNSRAYEFFFDFQQKLMCERAVRKRIKSYDPDVVVSVHPLMTNVPVASCAKISQKTGRHLPIFTVVTDLGSAHCLWFANGVDKMYIASDQIRELAKVRGKVPDEKLVQIGLPIRHEFAEQAAALGERNSSQGLEYQMKVRKDLELPVVDKKTVLVMGGGEGVGSLSDIVDALYVEFVTKGIDALILVVCGRNEKLKKDLDMRDWGVVMQRHKMATEYGARALSVFSFSGCVGSGEGGIKSMTDFISGATGAYTSGGSNTPSNTMGSGTQKGGCIGQSVTKNIRRILSTGNMTKDNVILLPTHFDQSSGSIIGQETLPASATGRLSPSSLPPAVEGSDDEGYEGMNVGADILLHEVGTTSLGIDSMAANTEDAPMSPIPNEYNAGEFTSTAGDSLEQDAPTLGKVSVVGLGFVKRMAEYMVASDILVSKAGPGTIAEAASVGLPVLLINFLPGQEEGNVDFVVEGKFGAFVSDSDPPGVAEEVASWLTDYDKWCVLSKNATAKGAPNAARDIVRSIGELTLKWKKINADRDRLEEEAKALLQGGGSNAVPLATELDSE